MVASSSHQGPRLRVWGTEQRQLWPSIDWGEPTEGQGGQAAPFPDVDTEADTS